MVRICKQGYSTHALAITAMEHKLMKLFNQRQPGTMIHIMLPQESVDGLLYGINLADVKEAPRLGPTMVLGEGMPHRFATMVVANDKTGTIERTPGTMWRRLDKAYVTHLHFLEMGWLKEGLELGMRPIKDSNWLPQEKWSAHLLADVNPKLDGNAVPSPPITHSSGRGGGRGSSRGWGESSDDNASASSLDQHPESRDGGRGRKGGGRGRGSTKWSVNDTSKRYRSSSRDRSRSGGVGKVPRGRGHGRGEDRATSHRDRHDNRPAAPPGVIRTSTQGTGWGAPAPPAPAPFVWMQQPASGNPGGPAQTIVPPPIPDSGALAVAWWSSLSTAEKNRIQSQSKG